MWKRLFTIVVVIVVVSVFAYYCNVWEIVETWNVKTVFEAIVAISASWGLFGGIPKIINALNPTPSLKVRFKQYLPTATKAYEDIIFEIENKSRRAMATNVTCVYVIYDEDNVVVADNYDRSKNVGYIAPKTTKTFKTTCALLKTSTPYKVYVKVVCDEGVSSSGVFPPIFGA